MPVRWQCQEFLTIFVHSLVNYMPQDKYNALVDSLRKHRKIAVACSNGVGSTLLLRAAVDALGSSHVLVIHGFSEILPSQLKSKIRLLLEVNFSSEISLVEVCVHPLHWRDFVANQANRCYVCKKNMYNLFLAVAENLGADVLLDGSNSDDLLKQKPGLQALAELHIPTPLAKFGFTRSDVRESAKKLGLSNAEQPSDCCLASRIAENQRIDLSYLLLIDTTEKKLKDIGFPNCRFRLESEGYLVEIPKNLYEKSLQRKQLDSIGRTVRQVVEKMDNFSNGNSDKIRIIARDNG